MAFFEQANTNQQNYCTAQRSVSDKTNTDTISVATSVSIPPTDVATVNWLYKPSKLNYKSCQ